MKPILHNIKQSHNILQIFASRTWGGGEQYVFDLGKALIKQGDNVFFASQKSKIIKNKLNSISQHIYFCGLFGYFDFVSVFKIVAFVRKHNIQIIHTHKFNHAFLCIFVKLLMPKKNLKVILTRHLVRQAKTMKIYTWLYKHLDKIVFVSMLAKEEFLSTNPFIDIKKIEVLYNSSYINKNETFEKLDLKTKYQLPQETILLGFSGRLSQEKGIEVLIEAMTLLPEYLSIHLFIAGDGKVEYKQQIANKIEQFGLQNKITLIGFCNSIPCFINEIDIAVLPSVQKESFGLSVTEFMQASKPVITTNNGAQKEYITHNENGILVNPNNPREIATAIEKLCTDKILRTTIGRNACEKFENTLSYNKFMERMNKLYCDILNTKKYRILIDLSKLQGVYCGLWEVSYQFGKSIIERLSNDPQWEITFLVPKKHPYQSKSIKYIYISLFYRYFLWLKKQYHLIHALSQNSPYIRLKNSKSLYLSTIHDLNFLYEKKGKRKTFYQQKYQNNLKGLNHIIFISQYAAFDAQQHLELPCPYSVILNGVDIQHQVHKTPHPIMAKINGEPFLFIISTVMRKKNILSLIGLMRYLPAYKLIVAGHVIHQDYYHEIKQKIKEYTLEENIFIIGAISEEEKSYFYSHCSAFVFPSLAEGFGVPPIEAMSYGKPVFVSDQTSIPEVCGDLAFYWKDFEPQSMARVFKDGMDFFNTHPDYAEQLKKYTLKYDWNRCIDEYIDLYKNIMNKNR